MMHATCHLAGAAQRLPIQSMNKFLRRILLSALFFLPVGRRAAVSRWLRGRQELKKLRQADIVFVTCPKSGRTWLRIMLSRILQRRHGLPGHTILGSTAFHRANPSLPVFFFTHDTNISNYTGNRDSKADYAGKRIVLLVRDPRDIAVSAYFQWKYRMDPQKRALHTPALEGRDLTIYEFATHPDGSLGKTIAMLNSWDAALPHLDDVLVVRYEDLRRDPADWLRRIAEFSGFAPTTQEIEDAVEFASLKNMKKMERDAAFGADSRRFSAGTRESSDAYKVRKGKVGGFGDYFTPQQITEIDRLVADTLAPGYGYGRSAADGPQ
jgi:hypothetical protein